MLQVARLAPRVLGESTELVTAFVQSELNPNGGFNDREGTPDLYYTVFGIDSLTALQADFDPAATAKWVATFGDGEGLDFVHLCCLARIWAGLKGFGIEEKRPTEKLAERILAFRKEDGGFSPKADSQRGTAYGAFLALGAFQDLQVEFPEPLRLVQSLKFLETKDGAWTNERVADQQMPVGSTNATAAVVAVLRNLEMPIDARVGEWLLARVHAEGGATAAPATPMPDLLSTATALHALSGLQIPIKPLQDSILDYIDTLWTNTGSFHGNWTEETLDVEYTFYGLLALGHLSL